MTCQGLEKELKIYGIGVFGYQSFLIFCRNREGSRRVACLCERKTPRVQFRAMNIACVPVLCCAGGREINPVDRTLASFVAWLKKTPTAKAGATAKAEATAQVLVHRQR